MSAIDRIIDQLTVPLNVATGLDSFIFLPVLLGEKSDRDPVRPHLLVGQSLRVGPSKWIDGRERLLWFNPGAATYPAKDEPPGQLYILADDLGEKKNLAAQLPEEVAELKAACARIQSGAQTRR